MEKLFIAFLISLLIMGCKTETPNQSKTYDVKGKVEKGPFIKGSKVTIQELNDEFTPTGRTFTTTITDDEGAFSLGKVELNYPFVELIADGYFYNEVRGDLSQSQITLNALADLNENTTININILTHLTKERVMSLVKSEKMTLKNANSKAQNELLTIFGLQKYSEKNVNTFSIANGSSEASALIVVSATLLRNKSEAQFTEFIANLANYFKSNGTFENSIIDKLREDSRNLELTYITEKIKERYASINKNIEIKQLYHFIDWDNDGIAGNEFGSMDEEPYLKLEMDTLKVGVGGGSFRVKINSNVEYSLTENTDFLDSEPTDNIDYDSYFNFSINIKFKTSLDLINNELIVEVEPAQGFLMNDASINIYSKYVRDSNNMFYKANVAIKQEGDVNNFEAIEKKIIPIIYRAFEAMDNNFTAEVFYSQCYTVSQNDSWRSFSQSKVFEYDNQNYSLWIKNYQAIHILNQLLSLRELPDEFKKSLTILRTFIYYQMTMFWGNIVYIDKFQDNPSIRLPQTKEANMYSILSTELRNSINKFSDIKNDNILSNSNHKVKVLLAEILMQQGEYQESLTLLESIVASNSYSLSSTRNVAIAKNSSEIIFAVPISNENSPYKTKVESVEDLPVSIYSEVLLLASECSNKLGQKTKALDYLNQVLVSRSLSQATSINYNTVLHDTWKSELKGLFSYFAFLKRNNLSVEKLNIQPYQNLLPIPLNEILINPNIQQNPGY